MRRGVLIAICLVLALPPAQAVAGEKDKEPPRLGPIVTASAAGPAVSTPGGSSTATATCPGKLEAVGGGYSAPFGPQGAMVVTSSFRSSRDSWQVAGTLIAGSGAATAYAYCRHATLHVDDVAVSGTLPSGSGKSTTVDADCPHHAKAIGGGFQMTSGPEAAHLPIPEESNGIPTAKGPPSLSGWRVAAQNSNTGAQTVTAFAYCIGHNKLLTFKQDQQTTDVPVFGSLTVSSGCEVVHKPGKSKGKRKAPAPLLSAGGFYSPFAVGVLPVHADSRIAGHTFIDTTVNGGSVTGPMTAQSQAICF